MARQSYLAFVFHLRDHPDAVPPAETCFADGVLVVEDGYVIEAGPWDAIAPTLGTGVAVTRFEYALIVPGFVDANVHYPQHDMIA